MSPIPREYSYQRTCSRCLSHLRFRRNEDGKIKGYWQAQKSPVTLQTSPISPQKSPYIFEKSPTYWQKNPIFP